MPPQLGELPPEENVPRQIARKKHVPGVPPAFPTKRGKTLPAIASNVASPPAPDSAFLDEMAAEIRNLLAPDNQQLIRKLVTAQVQSGVAYDYPIPTWARRYLLRNTSAGTGAAGQLYYWFDQPSAGEKSLPQNYATLTAGQLIAENARYRVLTLFADATCTDQGWEIRWMGLV